MGIISEAGSVCSGIIVLGNKMKIIIVKIFCKVNLLDVKANTNIEGPTNCRAAMSAENDLSLPKAQGKKLVFFTQITLWLTCKFWFIAAHYEYSTHDLISSMHVYYMYCRIRKHCYLI